MNYQTKTIVIFVHNNRQIPLMDGAISQKGKNPIYLSSCKYSDLHKYYKHSIKIKKMLNKD